jgi:hypothetical protein
MANAANRTADGSGRGAEAATRCALACEALETGKCLEICQDGRTRVLEVHRVGINPKGEHILSGWQIRGPAPERVGWKLINLEDAATLALADIVSQAPRPDYRRGAKQFIGILCQL